MKKFSVLMVGTVLAVAGTASIAMAGDHWDRAARNHDRAREGWGGQHGQFLRERGSHQEEVIHRIKFYRHGPCYDDGRERRGDKRPCDQSLAGSVVFSRGSTDWENGTYWYDYPPYRRVKTSDGDGVSCKSAGRILRQAGFKDVSPRKCTGKVYLFNANSPKRGNVQVKVSANSGDILAVGKR